MKARLFPFFVVAFLLSGCASTYRFGATLQEDLRDVSVAVVRNETNQPDLTRALTRALYDEIRRDGTLRVVPEGEAATRLEVTISECGQSAVAYSEETGRDPTRYRLSVVARAVFTKTDEAETVLWKSDALRASKTFRGGDLGVPEKARSIPEIARDLAREIVTGCVTPW